MKPAIDLELPENDFVKELQHSLQRKISLFYRTLLQFQSLRDRLAELLDAAISNGEIKIRTAKDVQSLVQAYAQLADAEAKMANAIASLAKALNERDSFLMVTLQATTRKSESVVSQADILQNERLLVPVIEGGEDVSADNDR